MKKSWAFSFYFLMFAGVAAYQPFLVLYFQSLGLSGVQIGVLAATAPLITVASVPLVTRLADRTTLHRLMMNLSLLGAVGALFLIPNIEHLVPLLGMIILATVVFAPTVPLADSAVMFMLGDRKDLYGRMRLGGTLGFASIPIVTGALIENHGLDMAFWAGAVLLLATFVVGQKLVHGDGETRLYAAEQRDSSVLLRNPHFVLTLLLGWSGGVAIAALGYLFPYMRDLGAGESMMGLALSIGTITEIPVLYYFGRFVKRFGAYNLLVLASAMSGLRFLLLTIAPDPAFVLLTQLINGINIPLLVVAGVTYADEVAPDGFRATAQGLFNAAVAGIGIATGGIVSGLLFDSIGARGLYFVMCLFSLAVLGVVGIVSNSLPPQQPPLPVASH